MEKKWDAIEELDKAINENKNFIEKLTSQEREMEGKWGPLDENTKENYKKIKETYEGFIKSYEKTKAEILKERRQRQKEREEEEAYRQGLENWGESCKQEERLWAKIREINKNNLQKNDTKS